MKTIQKLNFIVLKSKKRQREKLRIVDKVEASGDTGMES